MGVKLSAKQVIREVAVMPYDAANCTKMYAGLADMVNAIFRSVG